MRVVFDADVLAEDWVVAKNGYAVSKSRPMRYGHRHVAELVLGRPLPPRAVVHHINENKLDNRRGNLVLCPDDKYHQLLHARQRIVDAGHSPETHAICSAGQHCLPREEFSTSPRRWNGLSMDCRECSNRRRRSVGYNYWGAKTRQQQRDRRARLKAAA